MAMVPAQKSLPAGFHTAEELALYRRQNNINALAPGQYFLTPQNCKGCHGYDPMGLANVDKSGNDVNLYDDWETSMMGLSAVDPLWRAKVSHEILVNPAHANELQTVCTGCHAPIGHYTAIYKGAQHYTLVDLASDSLGLSGVSCSACHAIGPNNLGFMFSGNIPYDTNKVEYGPFDFPFAGPMQLYLGISPVKSAHVSEGRMCTSCHTLITNTVDLNGNLTGNTFVEQSIFHEWENSSYPGLGATCQICHMPQVEDSVKIAIGYTALPGRSPYNQHKFVGANSFMVNLIKTNKLQLGITAPDINFDSTLAATARQLKENSLIINASTDTIMNDTAYVSVSLINTAGHKFPGGYPARRAVLQLLAVSNTGDTLFASGLFDNNMEVKNINFPYELHHNVINSDSQTQIYEMVMGDVNGNKTTVLERALTKLKDNRLPPLGFTTTHSTYDTCFIAGNALTDPDFNKNGITEGTGRDIVHYHIPLKGFTGVFSVSATVYYQSVPPSWLTEMFTYNSPEIDSFRIMYANADKSPVLVVKDTLENIHVTTGLNTGYTQSRNFILYPNPTKNGKISVTGFNEDLSGIKIYNLKGQLFNSQILNIRKNIFEIELPSEPGIYIIQLNTNHGIINKRILRL
jgi:hypothetical protein